MRGRDRRRARRVVPAHAEAVHVAPPFARVDRHRGRIGRRVVAVELLCEPAGVAGGVDRLDTKLVGAVRERLRVERVALGWQVGAGHAARVVARHIDAVALAPVYVEPGEADAHVVARRVPEQMGAALPVPVRERALVRVRHRRRAVVAHPDGRRVQPDSGSVIQRVDVGRTGGASGGAAAGGLRIHPVNAAGERERLGGAGPRRGPQAEVVHVRGAAEHHPPVGEDPYPPVVHLAMDRELGAERDDRRSRRGVERLRGRGEPRGGAGVDLRRGPHSARGRLRCRAGRARRHGGRRAGGPRVVGTAGSGVAGHDVVRSGARGAGRGRRAGDQESEQHDREAQAAAGTNGHGEKPPSGTSPLVH